MAKIDLTKYGITGTTEVVYNLNWKVSKKVRKVNLAQ